MKLIDADELWMNIIRSMDYCDDILEIIEQQQTIELERKIGKWIHDGKEIECGRCGAIYPDYKHPICGRHKYCPNCGAKMEGEER